MYVIMLDTFLQLMAIIPVLIVVCVGLLIVRHHGVSRASTVSVHAGQHPKSAFILALTILIAGTLYYLNVWLWVGQKYHLMNINLLMPLAFVALLMLALFPAEKNRMFSAKLHRLAGIVIVLLMFIIAGLIAVNPAIDGSGLTARIAAIVFIVVSISMLVSFCLFKSVRNEVFLLQASYAVMFFVLIIVATFL